MRSSERRHQFDTARDVAAKTAYKRFLFGWEVYMQEFRDSFPNNNLDTTFHIPLAAEETKR